MVTLIEKPQRPSADRPTVTQQEVLGVVTSPRFGLRNTDRRGEGASRPLWWSGNRDIPLVGQLVAAEKSRPHGGRRPPQAGGCGAGRDPRSHTGRAEGEPRPLWQRGIGLRDRSSVSGPRGLSFQRQGRFPPAPDAYRRPQVRVNWRVLTTPPPNPTSGPSPPRIEHRWSRTCSHGLKTALHARDLRSRSRPDGADIGVGAPAVAIGDLAWVGAVLRDDDVGPRRPPPVRQQCRA